MASENSAPKFNYGGQAVMEGVMMRGAHIAAIAVRDPDGSIVIHEEALNSALYRGKISKVPFLRGLVGLWDALVLGTRALIWSANIQLVAEERKEAEEAAAKKALEAEENGTVAVVENDNQVITNPTASPQLTTSPSVVKNDVSSGFSDMAVAGVVLISLSLGIGLFFALPAAASNGASSLFGIKSRFTVDAIEGIIKLAIFIGYIALIGFMNDVKRLFGYHGAEHKTINAYEAGSELEPTEVQRFPIEHPRCGTAFLLTVIVLSIFVHTLTGRPKNVLLLIAARVAVVPIIAGIAYEILRFTARNANHPLVKMIIIPNLLMQRLTTRQPDNTMVEVAIQALNRVLAAEEAVARGEVIQPQEEIIIMPLVAADGAAD